VVLTSKHQTDVMLLGGWGVGNSSPLQFWLHFAYVCWDCDENYFCQIADMWV